MYSEISTKSVTDSGIIDAAATTLYAGTITTSGSGDAYVKARTNLEVKGDLITTSISGHAYVYVNAGPLSAGTIITDAYNDFNTDSKSDTSKEIIQLEQKLKAEQTKTNNMQLVIIASKKPQLRNLNPKRLFKPLASKALQTTCGGTLIFLKTNRRCWLIYGYRMQRAPPCHWWSVRLRCSAMAMPVYRISWRVLFRLLAKMTNSIICCTN